jgi:hypothetical protein
LSFVVKGICSKQCTLISDFYAALKKPIEIVVASFRKADNSSHAALENLFRAPKLLYKFYFHQTTFEESPISPRPIRN